MPHDKNGNRLEPGDRVTIEATVIGVYEGDEYCNCTFEAVEPMPPKLSKTSLSLNTRQVAKVLALLLFVFSLQALVFGQTASQAPPQVDTAEIIRRGDMVTRAGSGTRAGVEVAISDAMGPPADDSGRWFVTVITQKNCKYCDKLKSDFASDPNLKAFANLRDPKESWAHFNTYSIEDETQNWRWKEIKVQGFPTILIQPPRNRHFGDPATVVLQKTGYDGDGKKLATAIRDGIVFYVRKLSEKQEYVRQAASAQGQTITAPSPAKGFRALEVAVEGDAGVGQQYGVNPPFTVPTNQPAPLPTLPFEIPPQVQPQSQPQAPQLPNLSGLLMQLLGGLLAGSGTTNLLLLIVAGLAVIRTFRKATGQKLLLDDATFATLSETLRSVLGQPTTPKAP